MAKLLLIPIWRNKNSNGYLVEPTPIKIPHPWIITMSRVTLESEELEEG